MWTTAVSAVTVLGRLPHRGSVPPTMPSLSTWADETPPQPGRPGCGHSAGLWPNPRVHFPTPPRPEGPSPGAARAQKSKTNWTVSGQIPTPNL